MGAWPAFSRARSALLCLTLMGCAGPPATVVPADTVITLAPGERAQLAGSDFVVTFEKVVRDDRCPLGVFCVQFGDAGVAFRARASGLDTALVLSTSDTAPPAIIGRYRLELTTLAPIKRQDAAIPANAYRATITVSRSGTPPARKAP